VTCAIVVCATPSVDSCLFSVCIHFIFAHSKVREAEEKAGLGADAVANLQDLEAEETPETMMVSVLTGDLSDTGRADRCDRFLLINVCLSSLPAGTIS
jgi:hypothetical protein